MTLALNIDIRDPAWTDALPDLEQMTQSAVNATFCHAAPYLIECESSVEIGFSFADDNTVQELNRIHRSKDKPTNVLSFPLQDNRLIDLQKPERTDKDIPILLGDVVLGRQTIAHEAERESKTFAAHTMHLMIHGILHLLGQDHETDDDAETMERNEIQILSTLCIPNPYILLT